MLLKISSVFSPANKESKQDSIIPRYDRHEVVSYWTRLSRWYGLHNCSDSAQAAIELAEFCRTATNEEFNTACQRWRITQK